MVNNVFTSVILIILTVAFAIMLIIAWHNRGSVQSYDLLWPLIGGTVAAVFFFAKTFFAPLPNISQKVNFLLLTSGKEIVPLSLSVATKTSIKPSDGYFHTYQEFLAYKHDNKKVHDVSYFDLVEWSTLTWISQQYPNHWQVQRNWFEGISGGGGSISKSTDAEVEAEKISILDLLEENELAKEYKRKHGNTEGIFIYLPKGTKAKHKKVSSGYSTIELSNKNIVLTISFQNVGGGALGASVLGEKLTAKYPSAHATHFTISFSAQPVRLRQFSTRTQTQIGWLKEVMLFYHDSFSWDILKRKLEKYI